MNRILVATDFSTRSDRALRRAVLIAGQTGAGLTLLHVVDDDQPAYLIDPQQAAAQHLLDRTARTISETDGIEAEVLVSRGDPFAGILRSADEVNPDLIVIGPHRRQLLDAFVGTTAERTIRRSRRPVLMANAVPAAHYRSCLIAVDFDETSRLAAEAAVRLGLTKQAETTVLHLFDAPALGMMKRSMEVPEAIDHYVLGEERRARTRLSAFLDGIGLEHPRPVLKPDEGATSAAILACAAEHDIDLVVVGTNQRRGLKRFLLGSVVRELLFEARSDVLVVPPSENADPEGQV